MKLSEIQNEQALDILADIIEPAASILADEEVKRIYNSEPKLKLVSYIIKNHKKSVIEIMAKLDGKEPEDYTFTLLSLPKKILEIINALGEDKELQELFM